MVLMLQQKSDQGGYKNLNQIRIVNWLLTRRCNLSCDYCAIVKNYKMMPMEYPLMKHYHENEMPTEVIITALGRMKRHNPDMFHIFYGGEPMLRKDLHDIVNYCNKHDIHYTIISNNTDEVQPLITNLLSKVEYIAGFTSSVDPHDASADLSKDRYKKSSLGLERLKEFQRSGRFKDIVAEITVMKENIHLLYDLVKELSENKIYSDITFIDIGKNYYYDFSNIRTVQPLLYPTYEVAETLIKIQNDPTLLVHMKDILFSQMFNSLPSEFDCGIEKGLHNITVDADGTMRLCLRIRGVTTPLIRVSEIFDSKYEITKKLNDAIFIDKERMCQKCNHSCLMMSKYINETKSGVNDLVHFNKRI